jgi:choline dehydrogenase-like flavoprotein
LRYTGADDLLYPEPFAANVPEVLADHVVQRVQIRRGRAVGVEVARAGGSPQTISAGAVVVAAGAIGSAQLLHASGVRLPALGRYVMEHPMVFSRVALDPDLVSGVPADDPEFAVWIPASEQRPFHGQVVRLPVGPPPEDDALGLRGTADLLSFSGIDPVPENALTFDDHLTDAFGLPKVSLSLELSREDQARVAAMIAGQYRTASEIGKVHEGWQPLLLPLGSAYHVMGTTRLGADPETSVADGNGQVWDCSAMFVAGNGVLSERISCNPTLTTVALALRTADAILESHGVAVPVEEGMAHA